MGKTALIQKINKQTKKLIKKKTDKKGNENTSL